MVVLETPYKNSMHKVVTHRIVGISATLIFETYSTENPSEYWDLDNDYESSEKTHKEFVKILEKD